MMIYVGPRDIEDIERHFRIRNGAWTKEAVAYVGLSFPLQKGWKERLLTEGVSGDSPFGRGISAIEFYKSMSGEISPDDARWLDGGEDYEEEEAHEVLKKKMPLEYVKLQLNALEDIANGVKKECEQLREKIKEMRNLITDDGF